MGWPHTFLWEAIIGIEIEEKRVDQIEERFPILTKKAD